MCILQGLLFLFPQTFCSSSHRRRLSHQSSSNQSSSSRTRTNKSNSDLHFASSSSTGGTATASGDRRIFSPTTASSRKRSRASNFDIPQQSSSMLNYLGKDLSPTTQLLDLGGELDYQGQVLSRIVRDIHFQHEVKMSHEYHSACERYECTNESPARCNLFNDCSFQNGSSGDNPAIHGLEMVLTEIRGLREELREHQSKLDNLRDDVNMIINTNRVDTDRNLPLLQKDKCCDGDRKC